LIPPWARNRERLSTAAGSSVRRYARADGAREAAEKAVREADRAVAELSSIQMEAHGGLA